MNKDRPDIMIIGVGCILFSDEGFGVRVIQELEKRFEFPDNISLVDGGVLGVNLLGVISQPKHLIVVDAIRNRGNPGDLYRLEGEQIPERIRAKNSLHQVDFLEALTLCQALEHVPETVIVGIEPEDIDTMIDLAKAFAEMGDVEGAREMLEEALEKGSESHKGAINELMQKLG